jgi:hypothetical protein
MTELTEDQKLIKKAAKRDKRCSNGTRYPKKGDRHLFQGRREILGFIREHRRIFSVEMMCRVFRLDSYGIKALPFNYIVDTQGKIVAIKLRSPSLKDFFLSCSNT